MRRMCGAVVPVRVGLSTVGTLRRYHPSGRYGAAVLLGRSGDTMRWVCWLFVSWPGWVAGGRDAFGTIRLGAYPEVELSTSHWWSAKTCLRGATGVRPLAFGIQSVWTGWGWFGFRPGCSGFNSRTKKYMSSVVCVVGVSAVRVHGVSTQRAATHQCRENHGVDDLHGRSDRCPRCGVNLVWYLDSDRTASPTGQRATVPSAGRDGSCCFVRWSCKGDRSFGDDVGCSRTLQLFRVTEALLASRVLVFSFVWTSFGAACLLFGMWVLQLFRNKVFSWPPGARST